MIKKQYGLLPLSKINYNSHDFRANFDVVFIDNEFYNPVCVYFKNNRYYHVSGKIPQIDSGIDVIILDSDNEYDIISFSVVNSGNLTTAEKAYCIKKYISLGGKKTVINLLPLFGENAGEKLLSCYMEIAKLPECLIEIIHEKKINLKNSMIFSLFNNENSEYFSRLIKSYNFTASDIRIIAEILFELSDNNKIPFIEIIKETKIDQNLIKILLQKRYPTLLEVENSYLALVKDLHFPPNININHPENFEDNQITLTAKLCTIDDYKILIEKIQAGLSNAIIEKIISLVNRSKLVY